MTSARASAAIFLGGLALGWIVGWNTLAPPPPEKVAVIVAKGPILRGTKITDPEELFTAIQVRKGLEPEGSYSRFEDLRDGQVDKEFLPGEVVMRRDVVWPAPPPPVGSHAVCIKVGKHEEILAGLKSGSWVDVVLARPTEDGGTNDETLVPEVQVLALDGIDKMDDGEARPSNTLTLQLRREEATKIADAQREGELWVRPVLRGDQ
jgi:Flp pilus assembly protein CpaB